MAAKYKTSEGDIIDYIAWKYYGKQSGVVEKILEENPGLADYGELLPAGVIIFLPEITLPETDNFVRLWD